jgi:hypothetical protein
MIRRTRMHRRRCWFVATLVAATMISGCSDDETSQSSDGPSGTGGGGQPAGPSGSGAAGATGGQGSGASGGTGAGGSGGVVDPGPDVDTSDPQLYETKFTADQADPDAQAKLATQLSYLDTRVEPRGLLVVYLHGAGSPSTCGSTAHGQVLAGFGFHVLSPCYVSDYGVGNCGDDIEGCRLEAFEGVDHHAFIDIAPPDSIEVRVRKGLEYVQAQNPEGDWTYFIDGTQPRWSKIVVSGISHGASSSGVIGIHRNVERVIMLSGPLDTGQAWLTKTPLSPIEAFFGFTHTGDEQHPGHLQAFEDLGLPGEPTSVDGASSPYGMSHRLVSSAPTSDGHGSTQAGGASPQDGDAYVFLPVWSYLYGVGR